MMARLQKYWHAVARIFEGDPRPGAARRSALTWNGVLLGIAALFAILATIQYRWVREIDTAMKVRVRSDLEARMTQWSLDFYREISAICVALQVGPDSGAHDIWIDYVQRYAAWAQTEEQEGSIENIHADPLLVSRIYIWETSNATMPMLHFLDPGNARMEIATAPASLVPLLKRLRARSESLQVALNAWQLTNPRHAPSQGGKVRRFPTSNYGRTGWQFDEQIPAIVHPLVHHAHPWNLESHDQQEEEGRIDWIVVILDTDRIERVVLPRLASRYFAGELGLDYRLAVTVAKNPPHIIYSSDSDFPGDGSNAYDSTLNLFGPPPDGAESPWESLKKAETAHGDWPHLSGPAWFPVIQYSASAVPPWTLLVQRRAGSLETVVNRVWHTNFFGGLTVLVFLATSVALVVLAAKRVQRFAFLQMNFVTGVSHELRTPLAVMLSAAENILDGVVEEPAEIQEHGAIIAGQCRQLMDLVDRILGFGAGGNEEHHQRLQFVVVTDTVQQVLRNLAEPLRIMGMEVEQKIESALPCVLADPVVLSQCLQNLTINAMKYRGQHNWIGISAKLVAPEDSAPEIQISVQDRGIGVRDSELHRIFEPFYRSPEVVASNIQGTGLGLSVVQRGVAEMGGRLTVISTLGMGSTFTIHMPISESVGTPGAVCEPISDSVHSQ